MPLSDHQQSRVSNFILPASIYLLFTSVISSSPLAEGLRVFTMSKTLLSYIYIPVIIKFDCGFFGFSVIRMILPLLMVATPNRQGSLTRFSRILAPSFCFLKFSTNRFIFPPIILSPNITTIFELSAKCSARLRASAIPPSPF